MRSVARQARASRARETAAVKSRLSLLAGSVATPALWLLAAHFDRTDLLVLATVAAIEFRRTGAMLAAKRITMQQPWFGITLILLDVAAFAAAAAWLIRRGISRSA